MPLHDAEIVLRDTEPQLRDTERRSRDAEIRLRDAEIALHGVEIGLHGPEIALRGPEIRSRFAKSLSLNYLVLNWQLRARGHCGKLAPSLLASPHWLSWEDIGETAFEACHDLMQTP